MAEENVDHAKSLDNAVNSIQSVFGQGEIFLPKHKPLDIARVSTGISGFDYILGGGVPRARMIELYGPESAGKTTLALEIVKAFQQADPRGAYFIDAEHALDTNYAKNGIGVDLDRMPISQPQAGEDAMNMLIQACETRAFSIIVVDTIAALTPRAELDGQIGDSHMALLAHIMGQTTRKAVSAANKSDTVLLFLNQLRHKVGMFFGSPETQPGGNAPKFWSSIRLDIRRKESINEGTEKEPNFVGIKSMVKTVKNKTAPPFRNTMITIKFGEGVDRGADMVEALLNSGIVERRGSNYYIGAQCIGVGKAKAIEGIKADLQRFTNLFTAVNNGTDKDKDKVLKKYGFDVEKA